MKTKVVGMLDIKGMDVIRRVYDSDFLSPTISTCGGGRESLKLFSFQPLVLSVEERENKIWNYQIERWATL